MLLVVAVSRTWIALLSELPPGWDPSFHLLLAGKIQQTDAVISDWRPFADISLNYPIGSHVALVALANLSGLPLHAVFRLFIPALGVLTTAQVYLFATRATKSPIVLERWHLGPFRIELNLRSLSPEPRYAVIAEEPQPSSRDSDVTHPHVQGEQLCEGDGTLPIRAALREGRILDFFLIINNLLHTYNSSSPYVSLDEWDGSRCSECDYSIGGDDARDCERCETILCSECVRHCCECSASACSNCNSMCCGCEDDVCMSCAKDCRDCDQTFCPSCLQDDERCNTCHEQFQEQTEDADADPALLPLCVGEAAVLAGSG